MRKLIAAGFAAIILVIAGVLLWPSSSPGLVLYTGLDYGPAVAAAFTKETGIKVSAIRLSTGSLLARIVAQGGHPDWDIGWFDGATAAAALDEKGLLAHAMPAPANLTATGQSLLSADGAFAPTGFTLAGVFISAPARLASPPTGWDALRNAPYQGLVGMNDPSISGPTYPMLAGMLAHAGGWPQGQAYVLALKANGLHMFDDNGATLAALKAQAISLAIVQSSAAIYFAAHNPGYQITVPSPAYVLPNVMVEAKGVSAAKRQEIARFLAFVMRPDIQKLRQEKGGPDGNFWPITNDAPAPLPGAPALSGLNIVTLDPVLWGKLETTVNGWFAQTMSAR